MGRAALRNFSHIGMLFLLGVCVVAATCRTSGGPAAAVLLIDHRSALTAAAAGPKGAIRSSAGAPIAFQRKGIPLPSVDTPNGDTAPAMVLLGPIAFVATGTSLRVLNATSGRPIGEVDPAYRVADRPQAYAPAPPYAVSMDGKRVALVGYVVRLPGHGTTPQTFALEIDAVDTQAHRLWHTITPLFTPDRDAFFTGAPLVTFAGSSGGRIAVVVSGEEDGSTTLGFDIARHQLLWRSKTFSALAVEDGMAIGTVDPNTAAMGPLGVDPTGDQVYLGGLNLQTGKTAWEDPEALMSANVAEGNSGMVWVNAVPYSGPNNLFEGVNALTGTEKVTSTYNDNGGGNPGNPWDCSFDGRSTLVCSDSIGQVFGDDATTGKNLWTLPDKAENRIAPQVTAVYDGKVYGTTASGPVVLDARSGRDVDDSPGVAPVLLDSSVGIGLHDTPEGYTVEAYPVRR